MLGQQSPNQAIIALLTLVPAPSLGALMALHIMPGNGGNLLFSLAKIWLLLLPLIYFLAIEKHPLKFKLPQKAELITGIILGLSMFATIVVTYWLWGQSWIDFELVKAKAQAVGLNSFPLYLAGAAYWTFVNALIEEFVWRWFVYRQWSILLPSFTAVILSALCFTLHHTISLYAYFDWRITFIGSLGVFLAGAIWCWCYLNYRSIWSGYISHIFADLAIAFVGWQILF